MIAYGRVIKIIQLRVFLKLLYFLFQNLYYLSEYLYFFINISDKEQIDEIFGLRGGRTIQNLQFSELKHEKALDEYIKRHEN